MNVDISLWLPDIEATALTRAVQPPDVGQFEDISDLVIWNVDERPVFAQFAAFCHWLAAVPPELGPVRSWNRLVPLDMAIADHRESTVDLPRIINDLLLTQPAWAVLWLSPGQGLCQTGSRDPEWVARSFLINLLLWEHAVPFAYWSAPYPNAGTGMGALAIA